MKKHNKKTSKSKPSKNNKKPNSDSIVDSDIELIAVELDTLARQRLPDGVLQGELKSYEAEIRQDAILLALSWYSRQLTDENYRRKYPWIPAQALARALRIWKRDYLKAMDKEHKKSDGMPAMDEPTSLHPSMLRSCDWSASTIEQIVMTAILSAQKNGKISLINALIARMVYIRGVSVTEIAGLLGIKRSSIYQHLDRTKRITAEIISRIEPPMIDPM